MAYYNFRQDLREGVKGEETIVKFLESKGLTYLNSNNDNKYDIIMKKNNKEITYEIKTDVYCSPTRDTGNMFLEFECRGKASGIAVTKADWFVTYYEKLKEIWFIKTSDLINLTKTESLPTINQSGDAGSNTCGYLLKRKKYQKQFHVYKI